MCSKLNACNIFVALLSSRFAKIQTSNFCKVVWQYAEGVVGNITWVSLEISSL